MSKRSNRTMVLLFGYLFVCLVLLWLIIVKLPTIPTDHIQTAQLATVRPVTSTVVVSNTSYFPIMVSAGYQYLPIVFSPPPLVALNPPPGGVDQSPNAYLHWGIRQPEQTFVSYAVYLEANHPQPSVLVASGLTKPSFDPDTFALDTQYYWQVVATDTQGQQIAGPVWTFKVEPLYNPPAIGRMIKIPAGEFLMGCDRKVDGCRRDRTHNEEPLRSVYLDAYEIDKYEVTNLEYRQCVAAKACNRPRRFNSKSRTTYFNNATYNLYPVMFVSWWDGQDYCKWVDKRLPTEAEWEKAARGVIDTRPWPWGNEPHNCSRANYRVHCTTKDSTRVGSYPTGASPYGLMDMSGNVFEWVQDMYDVNYYSYAPASNPQGPARSRPYADLPAKRLPEVYFTLRGGSYTDNWWYSRVAFRHWGHHGDRPGQDTFLFRNYRAGFRCARSITDEIGK